MGYEIRLAGGNSTNEGRVEVKGIKVIISMLIVNFEELIQNINVINGF